MCHVAVSAMSSKDGKFQSLESLSWLRCTTDEHDPSLPQIARFRSNGAHSMGTKRAFMKKGGLTQTARRRLR